MKDKFLLFLKGLFMGSADVIPGVSGGTIAFITGIYPRLIHALSSIKSSLFLKGKVKKFLKTIDFSFFLPLGLGIILAILVLSRFVTFALESYTAITFAFFFGLILASAGVLYRSNGKMRYEGAIFLVLGFLLAYLIGGASAFQINHSLFIIFLSGVLAISAMLLPGISGAFILLLFGQYEYVLAALHNLQYGVIITFVFGAIIGLLAFSRLLDYVLRIFRNVTLSFLIGLMLGSLRVPIERIAAVDYSLLSVFFWAALGFIVVLVLESVFKGRKSP